jgi:hypothetical protein
VLSAMLIVETLIERRRYGRRSWPRRAVWFGILIAAVSAAAIAVLLPAAERFVAARWTLDHWQSKWALASTAAQIPRAYLPLPDLRAEEIWGSHWLVIDSRAALFVGAALGAGLFGAAALLFLRQPAVLFLYVAGTGVLLAFGHLVYSGGLRHAGHLFLLFVACLWLARLPLPEWRLPPWLERRAGARTRWAAAFVTALLSAQVLAAATLFAIDLRRPFTAASAAAAFLSGADLEQLPIAAMAAPPASAIAGFLDRPIHYLDVGEAGTFMRWGNYPGLVSWQTQSERLRALVAEHGEVVLITRVGAPSTEVAGLTFERLADFEPGVVRSERYVLYRVGRAAP